jgi:hypothetical protein
MEFPVNQLPNGLRPEHEITKRRIWSQFEAIHLLYMIYEYLFDVWLLRKDRAIKVCRVFHQHFLVYQLPNGVYPKRESIIGRTWSQFEALDLLYGLHKSHWLVFFSRVHGGSWSMEFPVNQLPNGLRPEYEIRKTTYLVPI